MAPSPEADPALTSTVDYEDFRLLIEGTGGAYRASVVESPAGESAPPETIHWVPPGNQPQKESDLRAFGTSLFDGFVTGQIRELYRESTALTRERGRGLRIKLLLDSPELSSQPWELLYDSRNRCYLGLSSKVPIVRHRRIPQVIEPLTVKPPLRILGMIANPLEPGLPQLNVDNERKLIETAVAELRKAGLVQLEWLDGGSWEELQKAMWRNWHVFHFIGHGGYDPEAAEGYVLLENSDGGAHRLAAGDLGLLLRGQASVRLAVLNSCKGAVGSTGAMPSSTADALVQTGMGGVVAMQNLISDKAAITFARVLYLGLANGLALDTAVTSARVAMKIEHAQPIEWWTPVLHMRATDGVLFKLPPPPAKTLQGIPGLEYLGPDLDARLKRTLARRRWQQRAFYAWMLSPIPFLGFLTASPVSSASVEADVQASGVSFRLSSGQELFSNRPGLKSFEAVNLEAVTPPGFVFPRQPGPDQRASISAVGAGGAEGVFLQAWELPAGSEVSLDKPSSARQGEYLLTLHPSVDTAFQVTLAGPVNLSLFQETATARDYGTGSPMILHPSQRGLQLTLQFAQPQAVEMPNFPIDELGFTRTRRVGGIDRQESTVTEATLRFDEIGKVAANARPGRLLRLNVQQGLLERFQLQDGGISFLFTGRVREIAVDGIVRPLPSRMEWLLHARPWHVGVGALAYILILLAAMLSWRRSHEPKPA